MNHCPKLESFCCGYSLRTGTIIVGYLDSICYTIVSLWIIVILVLYGTGKMELDELEKNREYFTYTVVGLVLIYSIGCTIMAIFLLLGVYKENPNFVQTYLFITLGRIIFHSLFTLFYIIITSISTIISLIWLAGINYSFFVVNSYYCTIEREEINVITV